MSNTRVVIVSAAHRADSQSLRIANSLNEQFLGGEANIVDLFAADLPMWTGTAATPAVEAVRETLAAADALIIVAPEWHGMAPAGLKNLLLWCGAAQLAHKPTLLVAVSSSVGGAFVIAELRGSGYKNSRLLYTPEHLILRNVTDLWSGKDHPSDEFLCKRARFAVDQLLTYAEVIKPVRGKLVEGMAEFANGMS
ncbi:NADPH-dependent FMN reductase [Parathalassolituus penaei]|uniref:NAD(P)H-dependent oxidoreductase n=1 Tax=Parathalassolituus penaei TaxID=2997323 RepID=A0A9X3EAU5_9GAMM|nr:NAD(P)H-dependent oxidoreductase [Parathalassolituus penaei]MCY0964139.1 NAD(P)H-dependent oxidoreductase [Parathalassolituus penaei]